jgi:hypothetical protein
MKALNEQRMVPMRHKNGNTNDDVNEIQKLKLNESKSSSRLSDGTSEDDASFLLIFGILLNFLNKKQKIFLVLN